MPNDQYQPNPDKIRRAQDYQTRALALFDAGFTTEQARKDALDMLNRAYDVLVHDAIFNALCSQRTAVQKEVDRNGEKFWIDTWDWDNEDAKLLSYENIPALHVWGPKHNTRYSAYPDTIRQANILKADRDAIKAAPLVAKKPTKTSKAREERAAIAKTCQICGRPILAETGKIAHHGYERPGDGYQTASCYGALHLPFEVSRDTLGDYIVILNKGLLNMEHGKDDIQRERIDFHMDYRTGRWEGRHEVIERVTVNRSNFVEKRAEHVSKVRWARDLPTTFDDLKLSKLLTISRNIKNQKEYIAFQEARYNAWTPA